MDFLFTVGNYTKKDISKNRSSNQPLQTLNSSFSNTQKMQKVCIFFQFLMEIIQKLRQIPSFALSSEE
jgi:hypothetical protein